MHHSRIKKISRALGAFCALVLASVSLAGASATLLLEEPYGKLGAFNATGHSAVYLSHVCADSPLVLRRCVAGEKGVVISRYNGVAGYDWIAIPLVPYLYAVERAEDVPLFADAKLVSFLRDQYRREHLESIIPDRNNGETPGGNWYELVGTSYDRVAYGFEIQTSSDQDARLIEMLNAKSNRSRYRTVSRNCADFVKTILNFYYPKALHRDFIADIGIATPKQMAKSLVRYSRIHPELHLVSFTIPQVPGSQWRSTPVHGVVESFLKSKKYFVPAAIFSPIAMGSVAAVYLGTGAGRFDPASGALIYNSRGELEHPMAAEDRRALEKELEHLVAGSSTGSKTVRTEKSWARVQSEARPELDFAGSPMLEIKTGEQTIELGVSASNIQAEGMTQELAQQLLEARLAQELHRRGKVPRAPQSDVDRDWNLLQKAGQGGSEQVLARSRQRPEGVARNSPSERPGGNRP